MQFYGLIVYDGIFWVNFLLGVLLSLPCVLITFRLSENILIRAVLGIYVAIYIFPFFIIQDWADHRVEINILAIHCVFFAVVALVLLSIREFQQKSDTRFISQTNDRSARPTILIVLIFIGYFGWALYFFVNPDHSGFLTFLDMNQATSHPRFSFYDADDFTKALFVTFLRLAVPVAIVSTHGHRRPLIRWVLVFCAALLAVQSVERQNLVILLFVLITIGGYLRNKSYLVDISMVVAALVLALIMQGNIDTDEETDFARTSLGIVFVRIFLVPFYLSSYLFETYDGPLLLGTTNRIFDYMGFDYASGWSAIGLMPDLYLNFGIAGYFFGALYFTALLGFAARAMGAAKGAQVVGIFLFYTVALVGLFYSNTLSLVPMVLYLGATLLALYSKSKGSTSVGN